MLIVHPNNFLQGGQGENIRVIEIIKVLKDIGHEIDLFSYDNFSGSDSFIDFDKLNSHGLINNLYVYDFAEGYDDTKKPNKAQLSIDRIKQMIQKGKSASNSQYLQDWAPLGACRLFSRIMANNNYDVISLFYSYQANLLKDKRIQAKKVYFMEDSMFLQQYSWDKDKPTKITLGKLLDEEIARIQYFDEVFCISYDEKIMYEKFTGKHMQFLPHIQSDSIVPISTPIENRRWDIMFIGFNNPFNVEGLNWFIREVFPHLSKDIKVVLVGSATNELETTYGNIDIIPFAQDLDEIFNNVKISICPMFRGTGMKIKVIEAMARGLPIVCNDRGVDGLPDKTKSGCLVTQDALEFAKYIGRLLEDRQFYMETVECVYEYYRNNFDRSKYVELLHKVI